MNLSAELLKLITYPVSGGNLDYDAQRKVLISKEANLDTLWLMVYYCFLNQKLRKPQLCIRKVLYSWCYWGILYFFNIKTRYPNEY